MPTSYVLIWSFILIFVVGLWRWRNGRRLALGWGITAVVLFFAQGLFHHLADLAGVPPVSFPLTAYLQSGPFGWLALLVLPCSWLAPVIALRLGRRE